MKPRSTSQQQQPAGDRLAQQQQMAGSNEFQNQGQPGSLQQGGGGKPQQMGEGSYDGARDYKERTERYVKNAEDEGKSRSKGEG